MTKRGIIAMTIPLILIAFAVCFALSRTYSVEIKRGFEVCSVEGEVKRAGIDISRVKNLLDPVHYEGTITLDDDVYTDHMQSFNIRGNSTLFERLGEKCRLRKMNLPYNDFRFAAPGTLGTTFWIAFINDGGESYVRLRFSGGRNLYGPADNADEAKRIEELFSYADRYDETSGW